MVSATPESRPPGLAARAAAAAAGRETTKPSDRPKRPFVVTLVALLSLGLSLWYSSFLSWVAFLLGSELILSRGATLSADVRSGPVALAAVGLVITIWSFLTAGGLRRGAAWARASAIVLAFFGLPIGFPADLAIAALIALLLFGPANARAFFGYRGRR